MRRSEAVILALLLLCYAAPWADAGSHGLRMNAYDWAEWLSLHPAQRGAEPPLLISLALRLQLLGFGVLLAYSIPSSWRWLFALSLLVLAAAQLPPLEFLSNNQDNNYRQQVFLAVSSIALGLLARTRAYEWREYLAVSASILSCSVLLLSLPEALALTQLYYAQVDLTIAPVAFVGLHLGHIVLVWNHKRGLTTAPLVPG
jgi:hypothetical protein